MMARRIATVAAFVAAICFFIAHLFGGHPVLLLLGGVWLCIGAVQLISLSKKK